MPKLGGNPMAAPDAPTRRAEQAEPQAPTLPLGF